MSIELRLISKDIWSSNETLQYREKPTPGSFIDIWKDVPYISRELAKCSDNHDYETNKGSAASTLRPPKSQ